MNKRNNTKDQADIQAAHDAAVRLGAKCKYAHQEAARRHSKADAIAIQEMHDISRKLGATCDSDNVAGVLSTAEAWQGASQQGKECFEALIKRGASEQMAIAICRGRLGEGKINASKARRVLRHLEASQQTPSLPPMDKKKMILVLEHLSHNQKTHAWRYGTTSKAKKSMKGFGGDERDVYKNRARKKAGLPEKPSKRGQGKMGTRQTVPGDGAKVSGALDVNNLPKKLKTDVQGTLDVIDSVHSDGDLQNIPIKASVSERQHGAYAYYGDGRPAEMLISTKSAYPMMTTAHEVGHYLDHHGVGRPGEFASIDMRFDSPQMANLRNTLTNSQAVQQLQGLRGKEFEITTGDISFITGKPAKIKVRADDNYINYLEGGDEVFARSYAQYIATKSQNPQMLSELEAIRNGTPGAKVPYPTQWSDADFAPIVKAYDELFASQGWVKNG